MSAGIPFPMMAAGSQAGARSLSVMHAEAQAEGTASKGADEREDNDAGSQPRRVNTIALLIELRIR